MDLKTTMLLTAVKPFAKKITVGLNNASEERGSQVQFLIKNQYIVLGERIPKEVYEAMTDDQKKETTFVEKVPYRATFLKYNQYMALDEEPKEKVKVDTIIVFLEQPKGKNVAFKTIDFLNLLNNI